MAVIQEVDTYADITSDDVIQYVLAESLERTFTPVPISLINRVFYRINVLPDGNCFYSSTYTGALWDTYPDMDIVNLEPHLRSEGARRLRMAVARRLLLSKTRRRRLEDAGIDPDDYANKVAEGAWADEAEILAASRELHRPVVVLERSTSDNNMALAWVGGNDQPESPIVVWRKNEHYDALVPRESDHF